MKSNKKTKAMIFVAAFMLLVFLIIFFNNKFHDVVISSSEPIEGTVSSTSGFFSNSIRAIFSLGDIIRENASLKQENQNLRQRVIDGEATEKENALLRDQLALKGKVPFGLLDANITSFEPSNLSNFVTINKGRQDGVLENMPVVLPGNILLGKIAEVYDNNSKVILIADSNNKVNVKSFFEDPNDKRKIYTGVLNGYFGKSLFMDLIEKGSEIKKNDLIVSSGLDGTYPENLIIGRVDIKTQSDTEVFEQAYITPAFLNIKSTLVFVITKY